MCDFIVQEKSAGRHRGNHTSKVSRPLLLGMLKRADRRLLLSSGSGAVGSPAAVVAPAEVAVAGASTEGNCKMSGGVADDGSGGEVTSPADDVAAVSASAATLLRLRRPRTPRMPLLGLEGLLPAASTDAAVAAVVPWCDAARFSENRWPWNPSRSPPFGDAAEDGETGEAIVRHAGDSPGPTMLGLLCLDCAESNEGLADEPSGGVALLGERGPGLLRHAGDSGVSGLKAGEDSPAGEGERNETRGRDAAGAASGRAVTGATTAGFSLPPVCIDPARMLDRFAEMAMPGRSDSRERRSPAAAAVPSFSSETVPSAKETEGWRSGEGSGESSPFAAAAVALRIIAASPAVLVREARRALAGAATDGWADMRLAFRAAAADPAEPALDAAAVADPDWAPEAAAAAAAAVAASTLL